MSSVYSPLPPIRKPGFFGSCLDVPKKMLMNYAPFLPFGKRGFSLSREKRNRIPDTPGFPQSKSAPLLHHCICVGVCCIFFLYLCLTLHLLSSCLQGVGKSDLENTLLFMFMSRESARCLVFSINLIVVLSLRRGVLPY